MKEVLYAIIGVTLGVTPVVMTYDKVIPRLESFAQGMAFYYGQPFLDKYINKPEAHFDLKEKPKCVIFECLHKETL